MPEPVAGPGAIPVHILTGFLGSGKTTLLNKWLSVEQMQATAVIVNEFGAVGVDQHLIAVPAQDVVLLDNGCVCCALREDLILTLADLAENADKGKIPPFQRVVVETTGLADPAPIVHTFLRKAHKAPGFRMGSVITVVDPVFSDVNARDFIEWHQQVACADHIVASKRDLVDEARTRAVLEAARAVNPVASLSVAGDSSEPPHVLTRDASDISATRTFFPAIETSQKASHSANVQSFCVFPGETLSWSQLALWLEGLVYFRGEDFLRIKGIVKIRDSERPVLIQSVQKLFHPMIELDSWPHDSDERSRVVFITRGIEAATVENALATVLA